MKTMFFYDTVIGPLAIGVEEGSLSYLEFVEEGKKKEDYIPEGYRIEESPLIIETKKQLDQYFAGKRKEFTIPLIFTIGTEFQQKVWRALMEIPYGETRSYKDIAEMVGSPKAARAVGGANNKNPIVIIVPCHRVIGADGSLVGFGGGMDIKIKLLEVEKNASGN